jgi:hypothetical protein
MLWLINKYINFIKWVFIKLIYLLINHKILSYNYLLLRDDFRIGLVISPRVAVLV